MLSRWTVIALLAFLTLIDLFGAQAILPSLTEAFGVDAATMGFAVNASTFGMAVAGLVVAYFSRKIPRRTGIAVSLALLSVPTFLLGMVDDITVFTALRVAQGVFMASAFALTMAYLTEECSASEAAAAMAAYITGNVLSNLVGRMMAAGFADWVGLSGSFAAFAALNVAGALLARHCLGQTTPHQAAGPAKSPLAVWMGHLANPPLRAGFAIGFLILFIFLGVFTYVNFILSEPPFNLGRAELGLVYLVFLPAVITTPMAGWLATRGGTFRAFALSMAVATVGLVALFATNLFLVLTGLALVGVGMFCAQAVVSGFVGRAATGDRAAASGLYLTSYYLGGLAGALLVGRVFEVAGWAGAVTLMIAAAALAVLCGVALRQLSAQRTPVASTAN